MGDRISDLFKLQQHALTNGDEEIDVNEPHPDIHDLFIYYRDLYFEGELPGVSVEWSSKRMTSCGGTCEKAVNGAIIKLSQPLLVLRPSRDLHMVLLHETIHAYCMINNLRDPDPTGHGPPFLEIMNRINSSTVFDMYRPPGGHNITVCHNMLAEVEYYKQHHWKCQRCGAVVKRAMNRKPQPADCRYGAKTSAGGGSGNKPDCRDSRCHWHRHLMECGGEFIKTKEPEDYAQKNKKKRRGSKDDDDGKGASGSGKGGAFTGQRSITGYLNPPSNANNSSDDETLPSISAVLKGNLEREERRKLLEAAALRRFGADNGNTPPTAYPKQHQVEVIDLVEDDEDAPGPGKQASSKQQQALPPPPPPALQTAEPINCPVCGEQFPANDNAALNAHLDGCLAS